MKETLQRNGAFPQRDKGDKRDKAPFGAAAHQRPRHVCAQKHSQDAPLAFM
ncbi:MAG TPA: hypothetical protein VFH51_20125 [Myxococcota bacterium]|nr:hypothetical protein [Myxococcota bacterium]